MRAGIVSGLICGFIVMGGAARAEVGMTPAHFWIYSYSAPRIPMAGDVDGDGLADFVGLYPEGEGIVDVFRTSPRGKAIFGVQARRPFGGKGVAAACGAFTGERGADTLGVFADGTVRIAHRWNRQTRVYDRDDPAATIPENLRPQTPARAVSGDFDGDGRTDTLVVGANGLPLLLRNLGMENGAPRFAPLPFAEDSARLNGLRDLAAGDLEGGGRAAIVWKNDRGAVFRADLQVRADGSCALTAVRPVIRARREERLAVGRFHGGKTADILVGQRLLTGGDPARVTTLSHLPDAQTAKGDLVWLAADFDGDGRDDLLRARRSGERFVGDDLYLHYARADTVSAQAADSDGDGLLDVWETGQVKPAGLDLPALGCSPRYRDVIVELVWFENVSEAAVRSEMERCVRFFAALPVTNPDGRAGIGLRLIFQKPIPTGESSKPWWELGEKYHPAAHRGITHWMVIYNAGGGQSGQMADRGSCGVHALYATFLHEFGHQLGLDHTGYWGPAWCPTYSSMMNYAYSYQRGGKAEDIAYSDGRLASIVLNERRLNEYLPLPMEKLSFLTGPPYHYRMKPAPDGKGTLIDWNWNGIFGEKNIAADINYGYSTTGGLRHTIGKTYTAPSLTTSGTGKSERLLLLYGRLPEGAPLPPADATARHPSLSPDQPGRLMLRVWQGKDVVRDAAKWSDEMAVEPAGVLGDPSAASLSGEAWVAYPMASGIVLRRISFDRAGQPQFGAPLSIPDSQNASCTLTALNGRLALLLWRDARTPVGLRLLAPDRGSLKIGPEHSLGFTSNAPVGAAAGGREKGASILWIALNTDQDAGRPGRWQVRKFAIHADGTGRQTAQEWIGGEKGGERNNSRLMLLWEPNRAFQPDGQVYFFGAGMFSDAARWQCHFVSVRIADTSVNGGWKTRRYYDEWTQSRSAPGVCFFRGDIVLAVRWFGNVRGTENDNLLVAFHGRGIESEPMGDFDDIALIRDVGLVRSIPYVAE